MRSAAVAESAAEGPLRRGVVTINGEYSDFDRLIIRGKLYIYNGDVRDIPLEEPVPDSFAWELKEMPPETEAIPDVLARCELVAEESHAGLRELLLFAARHEGEWGGFPILALGQSLSSESVGQYPSIAVNSNGSCPSYLTLRRTDMPLDSRSKVLVTRRRFVR